MIRTVVFGNGFARSVVLPCLRHVPEVQVVGIASRNMERAQETARAFDIPRVAGDHRQLLDELRPDLAFVVTPPLRHAEMAIDALEAGCHVVCEKPMAISAEETARMAAAASARPDRIAVVDHELRFLPARLELRRLLENGAIGSVRHADYHFRSSLRADPSRPWDWWSDAASGGGVLGAIGSHVIDTLRWLLGEVTAVRGTMATFVGERFDPVTGVGRAVTSDDLVAAWLRFSSGVLATTMTSTVHAEREHVLRLAGTDGQAEVREEGPLRLGRAGEGLITVAIDDDLPSSTSLGIPQTDWARAFLRMARALAKRIEAGERTLPGAATFDDGHRTQQVIDAVRRSSESANWVRVAEE